MTINGIRLEVGNYDEEYYCRQCETQLKKDEVNQKTWCCDTCNEKLLIKIEDLGQRLVRLLPSEISRFDDVFNYYDYEFVELKNIFLHDNKKEYILCIAEYGSKKVGKDIYVDCRWRH